MKNKLSNIEKVLKEKGIDGAIDYLRKEIEENNSFVKEINEENAVFTEAISNLSGLKGIGITSISIQPTPLPSEEKEEKRKPKKKRRTLRNAVIEVFEGSKYAKPVDSIVKALRRKGFDNTRHSINTTLSILTNDGILENPERGKYKLIQPKEESISLKEEKSSNPNRGRNGSQKFVLDLLVNHGDVMSIEDIRKSFKDAGYPKPKTAENALTNQVKKGNICKVSRGFYRAKSTMESIRKDVITISTIKEYFKLRKQATSKDLRVMFVDSGRMDYTRLHTKIKKLVDEKFIVRLERGVYALKE
jgi:Fe2+ or Zn2+ uptake regulation protein